MSDEEKNDNNETQVEDVESVEIIDEEHLDEKEKKLAKLKHELGSCRKDKEEYLSGWQRAKADYINFKKDEEKRAQDFIKFSGLGIFKELIVVADSMEKAALYSTDEGIKNTYAQMTNFLEKFRVKKIETASQTFDPAKHEAVSEEEVSDNELDNKVIEELQPGYMMHDRVLRPARVKVGIYKNKEQ